MSWIYKRCCFPLLHINNGAYTFLGGITVSLATNIFTTICIDDVEFCQQWNLYISVICWLIVSALLLYIATKISGFQNFVDREIRTKNDKSNTDIQVKQKVDKIILAATKEDEKKWNKTFLGLFVSIIAGSILLATNFS